MKIGMILDSIYPDDARITNQCEELINSKHEVFLFCLSYNPLFIKKEKINNINVYRYHCSNLTYKLSALANDVSFYNDILKKKIDDFIFESKVEILHIHDIQIAQAAISAASKFGIKYNLDLHENRPEIMKFYKHVNSFLGKLLISPLRWKKAEEKFIKKANKVIVVTDHAKKEILQRVQIDQDKIIVYPNTVRKSFFEKRTENKTLKKLYADKFVMIYVGNTSKRRGLLTVIKSLNKIKKSIPNIKLIILGKSSFDTILKQKVKDNNVENLVDFIGWVKESEICKYLSVSKIGLSPLHKNIHHDTTYANKVFQYISFNCPVISSNVTAQSELVKKYNIGCIFKDRSEEDFANKVIDLNKNSDLYNKLKLNCKKAIDKLNNSIISKQLISIYE